MRYNFKEEFVCKVQQSSFAAADSVGHQRRQEGIYTKSLESSTATRENDLQRPKISEWGVGTKVAKRKLTNKAYATREDGSDGQKKTRHAISNATRRVT